MHKKSILYPLAPGKIPRCFIENVTPKYGRLKEGARMGLNSKERQAVTREYKTRYQKAAKKKLPASKSLPAGSLPIG
jgi:hypothetical protein